MGRRRRWDGHSALPAPGVAWPSALSGTLTWTCAAWDGASGGITASPPSPPLQSQPSGSAGASPTTSAALLPGLAIAWTAGAGFAPHTAADGRAKVGGMHDLVLGGMVADGRTVLSIGSSNEPYPLWLGSLGLVPPR